MSNADKFAAGTLIRFTSARPLFVGTAGKPVACLRAKNDDLFVVLLVSLDNDTSLSVVRGLHAVSGRVCYFYETLDDMPLFGIEVLP